MRTFIVLALALVVSVWPAQGASTYDAELAKRLGADERGMRSYVLVILRAGPNDAAIQGDERKTLFAGHFANINRMAEAGKLVIAGPLGKNERQFRGIYILPVATTDEAIAELSGDPTVQRGVFVVEAYPLYGSAALMEVPVLHRRIDKTAN